MILHARCVLPYEKKKIASVKAALENICVTESGIGEQIQRWTLFTQV